MLRLIHTADWHLGHTLHGVSRELEHRCFLHWLLDELEAREADALLVAGDVFDSANPPAAAQSMLYRFLTDARARMPGLDVVLVAGNHDSPARLEAPAPLLDALGIRVVGAVSRDAQGQQQSERLLVPLRGKGGEIEAWCAAVPFLRPADLPLLADFDGDRLIEGVRRVYGAVLEAMRRRREPKQALIALGHCYMLGTRLSELSERRILGGNQHALPLDILSGDLAYGALGHLHLAQSVGGSGRVRYSGSPLPLALDERNYPHQLVQVELEEGGLLGTEAVRVPRSVEILRVPERDAATPDELERLLAALPAESDRGLEEQPYLEVAVRLERPEPGLRQRVEDWVAGKPVRLLKITPHYPDTGAGLGEAVPQTRLEELQPGRVFAERYRQQYADEPPPDLAAAFHQLLEALQGSRS